MFSFVLGVGHWKQISNTHTGLLFTAFQKYVIENVPSPNANSHYKMFIPIKIFKNVV